MYNNTSYPPSLKNRALRIGHLTVSNLLTIRTAIRSFYKKDLHM